MPIQISRVRNQTRSATPHCTQCRPRKGGTGIPVAGLPTEPYPSRRSGLDYLGSNSCTLFINYLDINNIDKTQNYVKIAFFFSFFSFSCFMFTCLQTVPYRYLIVILVKVASCSCVHSFADACSFVSREMEYQIWNGNVPIWNGTLIRAREEQSSDFLWRCAWNS